MKEDEALKVLTDRIPKNNHPGDQAKEFDNYSTTDDHGMHIIGLATDQAGNTFYKVKNSWGITGKYDGFIFVSRAYVMLRTTNIMVNKNAIPAAIAKKMGII